VLQLPATYTAPLSEDFPTDGDKLIELTSIAWKSPENPNGLQLDEWQKWLLRHLFERYPEGHENAGELRYRQVVVSMGRQNGKSLLASIIGVYGMLMHQSSGASVISLASSIDQARIIYNRVLYVIQANPFLSKRFKKASESRGIVTSDGSGRYDVKPAKENALQGIPISLCLFDELHLAKEGMWNAAIKGTQSYKDGIVIGITTAGDQNSETLLELYKKGQKAVAGDKELERFGFFVWEAPQHAKVSDPEAIKAANPAIACGRIPLDRVMTDLQTLPEHEVRRYTLNQFISGTAQSWIPSDIFRKSGTKVQVPQAGGVFAVDISKNWEHASIAYANRSSLNDSEHHSELVRTFVNPTEGQLFNYLVELNQKFTPRAIALDDRSMASNLGKRLKLGGFPVWQLWTKEVSAACSAVYAMFATGQAKHNNDPLVIAQSPNGIAKYSGETWLISRKDSQGDIDALMATVLSLYVSSRAEDSGIGVF
jgi:phage terminase large subunit-like protein